MRAAALRRSGVFAGVALATLAVQLPFFDRWFSAMDEGHVLLFSEIVSEGGTLYRDATLYPLPGAFYLLAGLFRLFEPSILVARWTVVIEFALFAAVVHDLLRRALPAGLALAVVPLLWAYRVWCFPHWQMYSYSTTALLFYALSLRLLLAHLESQRRGPLLAAGLAYGLGVFCKQDYGVAALLASGVALGVAGRARALATFLLPAAGVGLLAGLHFLERGVLADVLRFCVVNHFRGMADFDYWSFPPPWPLLSQDPVLRSGAGIASSFPSLVWMVDFARWKDSVLYTYTPLYELYVRALIYGPWLVAAGGALRLWRTRARLHAETASRGPALAELLLCTTLAAFLLLLQLVKPQDYAHLAVLLWPLPCLALVYAHALWRARPRLARGAALLVVPLVVAALAYTAHLAWGLRVKHPAEVPLARARGIYVQPSEAQLLKQTVDTIVAATAPDQTVGVFPYFPILHFLSDRRGPHRAGYIVWPWPEIEQRDRALIDALEAQHVPLVIYHFTQFLTLPRAEVYAPELFAYLVEHFEIFRTFSADRLGYKLAALRRDEAPPPGRALLRDLAQAHIQSVQDGRVHEITGWKRDEFARLEAWPFRPVLALRPTAAGHSVLSLPLRAESGERLRTAIGVHPDKWSGYPPCAVIFRIELVTDGARTLLFERRLDPQRRIADRGWHELDLPLDAVAGRDAQLELSTEAERPACETLLSAGFAVPRAVAATDQASGLRPTTR